MPIHDRTLAAGESLLAQIPVAHAAASAALGSHLDSRLPWHKDDPLPVGSMRIARRLPRPDQFLALRPCAEGQVDPPAARDTISLRPLGAGQRQVRAEPDRATRNAGRR
ncbi:MAG: hypothetical protein JWL91_228 [Sphingomonas bacterium]|nr:hypothetical protein [Sphingomonas bacterium]